MNVGGNLVIWNFDNFDSFLEVIFFLRNKVYNHNLIRKFTLVVVYKENKKEAIGREVN